MPIMFILTVISGIYRQLINYVTNLFTTRKSQDIYSPVRIGQYQLIYYMLNNNLYSIIAEYDQSNVPDTLGGARRVYVHDHNKIIEITNQPGILYGRIVPSEIGTHIKMVSLADNFTVTFYGDNDISLYLNGKLIPYDGKYNDITFGDYNAQ